MSPVQENIGLAPLTTLGIGGPARYFVEAFSEDDVLGALEFASGAQLPLVVLGGGSNLLVSDSGFEGLVLRVSIGGTSFSEAGQRTMVTAGAGVDWDTMVGRCVVRGLGGIECLSGIPGWVGGTPVQNVGAYGQDVSDAISRVRAYDRTATRIVDMSPDECGFSYRTSVFNSTARGRYIILGVTYLLDKQTAPAIEYPDLERFFAGRNTNPTVAEVRGAVLDIRRSKAMLLVDGDPDCRSAGSFFKNPVVDAADAERVDAAAGQKVPRFPARGDRVKLPAAWLIERAGFPRGTTRGNVGLSNKHALALINRGDASARDVLSFAWEIRSGVEARFGIQLRPEPVFLGFDDGVAARLGAVSASG